MKTQKNEFLGEIPSIEKYYKEKVEKKEKELKESKDINKAFKLSKEVDELKDEWNLKIEEAFKAGLPQSELKFEPLANVKYTVEKVEVTGAGKGSIQLKFKAKLNEDLKNEWGNFETFLFVYFKGLDKDGKEIEGSKTVAASVGRPEMKAGSQVELTGTWQTKAIINMEQFAAVKEITKEEYEKK